MMIQTGLEVLLRDSLNIVGGRRVGVVTHPAAVTADLRDTLAALQGAGVTVSALFGPEHGLYGMVADGEEVAHGRDPRTGLPVYSLYGKTKEPTPEMLENVDCLIFDMQDVGVRFYTYLSTLVYVMQGAAKAGKAVIVLDRPNPVTGTRVEGPLLEPGFESFVGIIPIPLRHGLTLGELARWFNARMQTPADLTVIPMRGWQRGMWFDQTGLPWVLTSPAMGHLSTATVYPGMCLIEGTNYSEGRGTSLPFEVVGAPWVDGWQLAQHMNRLALPGVIFRPLAFIPTFSKHQGKQCSGVQLHVMDRELFQPLRTTLHLLAACRALNPDDFRFLSTSWEGRPAHFDLLLGNNWVRHALEQGTPPDEIVQRWAAVESGFLTESHPYLLYAK